MKLTTTTPFWDKFSPSLCGVLPPPSEEAPPKIHTLTACFALARGADVHTLRNKQSSLIFGESGRSTVTLFGLRLG